MDISIRFPTLSLIVLGPNTWLTWIQSPDSSNRRRAAPQEGVGQQGCRNRHAPREGHEQKITAHARIRPRKTGTGRRTVANGLQKTTLRRQSLRILSAILPPARINREVFTCKFSRNFGSCRSVPHHHRSVTQSRRRSRRAPEPPAQP